MTDSPRLLVVDDDQMVLDFACRALTSLGYTPSTAKDAPAALRVLEEEQDIQVMIIDLRLGQGPSGTELARQALALRPDLGLILTSGDAGSLPVAGREMPRHVELLPKPYRRRDMADRLARLL